MRTESKRIDSLIIIEIFWHTVSYHVLFRKYPDMAAKVDEKMSDLAATWKEANSRVDTRRENLHSGLQFHQFVHDCNEFQALYAVELFTPRGSLMGLAVEVGIPREGRELKDEVARVNPSGAQRLPT